MSLDHDTKQRVPTRSINVSCTDCSLNPICLPVAVDNKQLDELDRIIKRSKPMKKGEHLFRASDPFASIYAVRSGTIKTYSVTEDGEEQVTGFYLPGEVLGIDGINTNVHSNSAKALETAAVCEIPFDKLEVLSAQIPSLQRHFFQLMSREIQADQQLIMLLSKKSAEERIASLLLSISARHTKRGLSASGFRLPMSRNDIGNFLGLAVETVSRVFTRLQKQGVIHVDGKEVEVLDMQGLCHMSNGMENKARTA
ncbi:MAG: fumarate/nitrate reduction transcriptional regulator Fnr [Pseudomonadota bacterium]|nr:Crp/Fnr family transcriptional regulator [Pseudomonadales bacterium]MDY6920491.1 fumarate/nitrate reduction transcriptional regulator Fnr [Pseudomonadota bacterium]